MLGPSSALRRRPRPAFLADAPPRVFAHRGLATEAPENTLLAFARALEVGADVLETDVHASRDGVAVIAHDPDLTRVAGRDVAVADLTLDELAAIDLGHGQHPVSFAEALAAFPDARFNVDVKHPDAAAPLAAAVRAAGAADRVLVGSFREANRRAVVDAVPGIATSASPARVLVSVLAAHLGLARAVASALHDVDALQVPRRQSVLTIVTRRTVRAFHAAGVEVHVWTVNDPAEMRELLAMGVDGIVTDRADLAVPIVAEARAR